MKEGKEAVRTFMESKGYKVTHDFGQDFMFERVAGS